MTESQARTIHNDIAGGNLRKGDHAQMLHKIEHQTVSNPAGAGVALVGAGLILIGSFTPVHTYGAVPIVHNSYLGQGAWWVLILAVAIGISAAYPVAEVAMRTAWQIAIPSVIAIGAGVWGLTSGFQRLGTIAGTSVSLVATPAIGVYLVLAGGILGLAGAGLLSGKWRPFWT